MPVPLFKSAQTDIADKERLLPEMVWGYCGPATTKWPEPHLSARGFKILQY